MAFMIIFGLPVAAGLLFLFRVQVLLWQREARNRQPPPIIRRQQQYSFDSVAWTGWRYFRARNVMISKPFEKFIEALQAKDAALYGRLCHLSPSLFWQEWKKVHPEDFPDGGNSAAHPSSIKLGGQRD